MALIPCKECEASISDQASTCPQCGISDPSVPFELQKLFRERDALKDKENEHAELYQRYYDQMDDTPLVLLRWKHNKELKKKVEEHTALANQAQSRYLDKCREISAFEDELRKQRYGY